MKKERDCEVPSYENSRFSASAYNFPSAIPLLRSSYGVVSGLDAFERLLWWLFAGSVGAGTRAQVLSAIKEQPRNAQQLSQHLRVDYTTVRHHLKVLERNRLIIAEGETYGKVYFLSDAMESHWTRLEAILEKKRGGSRR